MSRKKLPCIINGVHYESEYMATNALGISRATLRLRLISPNFPKYLSKHHSKRILRRTFIPCSINGVEYRSITSASKELELSRNAIKRRLSSLDYPNYTCACIVKKPPKTGHKKNQRPCNVDGIDYESEGAAARTLKINVTALRSRFRSSNFPGYTSKYHTKVKRRKMLFKRIRCSIKGVEYISVSAAARNLKKRPATIFKRLRSFNFPDYVCANIPKKPLKTPKYRYTVNGKKHRTLQEIADMEGVTKEWVRQKMNNPKHSGYQRL